jgi:hypothetical protein
MRKSARRPRAILIASQVVAIFQYRAVLRSSSKVSRMFGVSEKTIRDIWVGRTWKAETQHLDTLLPLEMHHANQARALDSAEEARWPLTASMRAGFQDKDSLDFGAHALLSIESDRSSPNQSIDDLLFDWEQAGSNWRL